MGRFIGGGRGRGYRHVYYATGLPRWMRGGRADYAYEYPGDRPEPARVADDLGSLKQEAEFLEERLKAIAERISDLETDSGKDNG
jgi:hypothetical protein